MANQTPAYEGRELKAILVDKDKTMLDGAKKRFEGWSLENPATEAREGLCGSQHYAWEEGVLKNPSMHLNADAEELKNTDLKNAVLEVLPEVNPEVTVANLTRCCALRVLHSQRRSPSTGSDSSACLLEKIGKACVTHARPPSIPRNGETTASAIAR